VKKDDISTLIRHRLEQAKVALDDAKFLLDGNRSPRSVINRSYYAMFYAALALLQKIGKVPSKHKGVISLFDAEFVKKGIFPAQLSKDLHKAFELRQVSDYKITQPLSPQKAEDALDKSGHFVEAMRNYLLTSPTDHQD
jgi:hypothetical protein